MSYIVTGSRSVANGSSRNVEAQIALAQPESCASRTRSV
jgi:hypothetical protein